MAIGREFRKLIGAVFADPRHNEKVARLERELDFLYRFLELPPGERQYSAQLSGVRPDHLARYRFACDYIQPDHRVVDAACGIGYGSYLMARDTGASVCGVDISEAAIKAAKLLYSLPNNSFEVADCTSTGFAAESF